MTNWRPDSIEKYRDVQTIWGYHNKNQNKSPEERLKIQWRSSRDNARTPVQWSAERNGGFTTAEEPWMEVNENYRTINVAQQEQDENSILNFYRRAIRLRKSLSAVRHGKYREHRPWSGRHYLYSLEDDQQRVLVVCSYAKKDTPFRSPRGFDLKTAQLSLCSYPQGPENTLRPYEARVYVWEK